MKFGEQLERDLVPEWRSQYLNYRNGKRYIKAIARAVVSAEGYSKPYKTDTPKSAELSRRKSTQRRGVRFDEVPLSDDNEQQNGSGSHARSLSNGSQTETPLLDTPPPSALPGGRRVPFATAERDDDSVVSRVNSEEESQRRRSRPIVAPLVIPDSPPSSQTQTQSQSIRADRHMFSPDTPGAIQRFATFARVSTLKLENKIPPTEMVAVREQEFFSFLDRELHKIEMFYGQKEYEAGEKLNVIREQLHIMRTKHTDEVKNLKALPLRSRFSRSEKEPEPQNGMKNVSFTPVDPSISTGQTTAYGFDRDFVRRKVKAEDVSYRRAKTKLRLAIQEYYRSLELLKQYSMLNRTAFRKLLKKYTKVHNSPDARSAGDYMSNKIDIADFVTSNTLEEYVDQVEDLYTRYFESGNRKLARTNLRGITAQKGDKSGSAFINGILIGVGFTFAIEGTVLGVWKLDDEDEDADVRAQTAYLLQIYAGYFLMLYLFSWFCIACRIWKTFKINYAFIFEFDPKHDLDWRQLSEFPSILTLLFGILIWLNFSDVAKEEMFLWYPVVLIGVTALLIFCPLPILRWRSRRWFVVSHARLLLSGLFAVEFRDFFLGDQFCSLSYAVANAEVFFCLYTRSWNNPAQCSSRRSVVLGFLAALPGIWRALQCLRRFAETRNAFPHLANMLKYSFLIGTHVTLSLYRRKGTSLMLYLFIGFSAINAIYALVWDILLDFSLLQLSIRHKSAPLLRPILAFAAPSPFTTPTSTYPYYLILIVDPVLRFSWVLLAIFSRSLQHGSIIAFGVALIEVTRRGLWNIFRVENEHCANIASLKASRDMALPYKPRIDSMSSDKLASDVGGSGGVGGDVSLVGSGLGGDSSLEAQAQARMSEDPGSACTRRAHSFTQRLARAHSEDFIKRRPTVDVAAEVREERESDDVLQSEAGSDHEGDVGGLPPSSASRGESSEQH